MNWPRSHRVTEQPGRTPPQRGGPLVQNDVDASRSVRGRPASAPFCASGCRPAVPADGRPGCPALVSPLCLGGSVATYSSSGVLRVLVPSWHTIDAWPKRAIRTRGSRNLLHQLTGPQPARKSSSPRPVFRAHAARRPKPSCDGGPEARRDGSASHLISTHGCPPACWRPSPDNDGEAAARLARTS